MHPVSASSSQSSGETAACENCGAELLGAYCYSCGQPARSPLSSARVFFGNLVADILNLDSRALRTAGLLLARPGALTAEYLAGRRVRYASPLHVFLAAVTLFFLVNAYRPFITFDPASRRIVSTLNAVGVGGDVSQSGLERLASRGISAEVFRERFETAVTGYLPTFLIGWVLLLALVLAGLFRRHRYRYLEHAVFAVHWTAFYLLLMILERLLPRWQPWAEIFGVVLAVVALTYLLLALRRVYQPSWLATIGKALALFVVFQLVLSVWMLSAIALAFAVLLR